MTQTKFIYKASQMEIQTGIIMLKINISFTRKTINQTKTENRKMEIAKEIKI